MLILALLAILIGAARRILFGWEAPLWFDETFTGVIARQPTFSGLVEDLLGEIHSPPYYTLIWAWEKFFGSSNLSLRLPSVIFALAAPLLILFKGHPDKVTKLVWTALVALWVPGFYYATEARAYTLIFLLASAQLILFIRLMTSPSLARAAAWCAVSSLLIFSHYHALVVTGLQGLAYVGICRGRALRTWPAGLFFLPLILWMIFHFPIVFRFSTPELAWPKLLTLYNVRELPGQLLGLPRISILLLLLVGGMVLWDVYRRFRTKTPLPYATVDALAAAASILSILIVFGLGFIRPNFVPRYLFPFMPGALFAIALWARAWGERWKLLPGVLIGAIMLCVFWETSIRPASRDGRYGWNWELASRDLASGGARRLVFLIDSPPAPLTGDSLKARVGSFFFDREGRAIPTVPVTIPTGSDVDPNRLLLRVANRPGDAIIWVFGRNQPNVAAMRRPPALHVLDPTFECRDYGRDPGVVITCLRRGDKAWPDSRQAGEA